jgi:hypothetical protein
VWLAELRRKTFAGWPAKAGPATVKLLSSEREGGVERLTWEFQSQADVPLRLSLTRKAGAASLRRITLRLFDSPSDDSARRQIPGDHEAFADFHPRGNYETGVRRRFMLIGQTLDEMRVWDICRAVQALRSMRDLRSARIWIDAEGSLGVDALYASLFEKEIAGLDLRGIPASHRDGPEYLNVLRVLDIPEAAAMAAENCALRLRPAGTNGWDFLRAMARSPCAHLNVDWEP